jgi:hypothetical protein
LEIYLISFFIILLMMLAMAIGLLFGKNSINSTCGGVGRVDEEHQECGICSCDSKPRDW